MAVRPEPLVDGLVSLAPPSRRDHVRHVLRRLRDAWIGWMQGVAVDMLVTGVLVFVALTIIGLEFAIFFAVLSALLVVVPYFGAIAGAIPPTLLALTDSPGKALLVLVAYVIVQQVEGNVIVPLVMSRTVRVHPAMIAIGVVVVGQLFGVAGLFVAVPVLSLILISVEEFWVKPIEEADRQRREVEIELPRPTEEELAEAEEHPLRPAS
jgi:predicted PurR-regulated permease PerM